MEAGLKKLLDRREVLLRQKLAVAQELDAIDKALNIIGFATDDRIGYRELESAYANEKPFKAGTLSEACLRLMSDCSGVGLFDCEVWIDKSEAEHLLHTGGFRFGKGNPTNSIEVTLRRLAAQGKCSVQKRGGPYGSKYSGKEAKSKNDVTEANQRATTETERGEE